MNCPLLCVSDWEPSDLQEQFGIAYYLSTNQNSLLSSSQTLTVKDLLLSNLGQNVRGQKEERDQNTAGKRMKLQSNLWGY